MVAADLKSRLERSADDPPRKMPATERAARHKRLQERLVGLQLVDELECSHALVDKFAAMAEEGVLRYIPWDELTKRESELQNEKKTKEWRADSSGLLREHTTANEAKVDLSTDLRMKYALQRRGLAAEQAGLLTFEVHDTWVSKLLREYLRVPPPGYQKISVAQVQRADRELFKRMAEETRGGFPAAAPGKLPLDNLLPQLIYEPCVQMLLLPL
eukprot:26069-Alexandrium_andersonii.AAC.1